MNHGETLGIVKAFVFGQDEPPHRDLEGFTRTSSIRLIWPTDLVARIIDNFAGTGGAAVREVEEWSRHKTAPI